MLFEQLDGMNDGVSLGDTDKRFGVVAESLNEMVAKPGRS